MLANTIATLYRRIYNKTQGIDEWERCCIGNVWWYTNEKSEVTTDGLKTADLTTVRIPKLDVDIRKDDYIVKGFCNIQINTVKDLKNFEYIKATSVNYNTFGTNPHIKVVGV